LEEIVGQVARMGSWEFHVPVQWVCLKERDHWEATSVDGRIIWNDTSRKILEACTDLVQDTNGWWPLFNMKLGGFIQCGEFLDELRNCQLHNTLLVRFVCELLTVDSMTQKIP
jgi:hypothetical protein